MMRDHSHLYEQLDDLRQTSHSEIQTNSRERIESVANKPETFIAELRAKYGVDIDAASRDEKIRERYTTIRDAAIQRYAERTEAFALAREVDDVRRALQADRDQQFVDGIKSEHTVPLEHAEAARKIRVKREALGRRGSWVLSFMPGAVLGVSAIVGGLHAIENSASAVHDDSSILPGAALPGIPGVPDVRGGTIDYDVLQRDGKVVVTSHGVVAQDAASGNTASDDFNVLKEEHALNRRAASAIIDYAQKQDAVITVITAKGYASDEAIDGTSANLGKPSIDNEDLAERRAVAGIADFKVEAGKTTDAILYNAQGTEAILTKDQIAKIDTIARNTGLSRAALTYAYNHDSRTMHKNPQAEALLDTLLGAKRGLSYEATLEITKTHEEPNFAYKTLHQSYLGIPGEIAAFFVGTQWGLFSSLALYGPISGRLARHRARRQIAKV